MTDIAEQSQVPEQTAMEIAAEILRNAEAGRATSTPVSEPKVHVRFELAANGYRYPIDAVALEAGRDSATCGVVLLDRHASRRHFAVQMRGPGPTIRDLGSSNGTAILRAGGKIEVGQNPTPLAAGDLIVTIDNVQLAKVVANPEIVS